MESMWNLEPDFSRLRKVLKREGCPDRVPFYELFADVEFMEAILGHPVRSVADRVEYQFKLGYDFVTVWVRNVEFPTEGVGVTEDTAYLTKGQRKFNTASMGLLHSWEDFEKYPWPDISGADYSELEEAAEVMPDGMKAIVLTGHVLEVPMAIMGYEGLSYALMDAPDLVEAVFERVGSFYEKIYEACTGIDSVGAMLISDDLGFKTGTLISPEDLRKYVFPWYKRYVNICHAADIPVILHSCGQLSEVMGDIIGCGIDAKHSYEDQILPVTEAKRRYGDKLAILGGIDMDFLCTASAEEVRKRTREVLSLCMEGGGYALGTGNSVANYVPVENFLAMLDEGVKMGRYGS